MGFKFPKKLPKEWMAQLEKTDPSKSSAPVIRLNNGGGDPNFGYEGIGGSSASVNDYIRGSVFTITEDGIADSITVYLRAESGYYYKCAIYRHDNSGLVGETEERDDLGEPVGDWHTFNFSDPKPELVADTAYVLVVWGDEYLGKVYYTAGDVNQGHFKSIDYNSFPDPISWSSHNTRKYSIYCSYTATGPQYKTINSNARIKVPTTATINGNARIKITQFQEVTGNALIILRHYETVTANARIKKKLDQTITGESRIKKGFTKTVTGNAKIFIGQTHYETIAANARIKVPTSKTITGVARVKKALSQTVTGNARIIVRKSATVAGNAKIVIGGHYETITGNAYIESIQRYETPLSYRFDRETKARAIAGVANSIGYEWWINKDDILCFYDQRGHDKSATITLGDEIITFDNSFDATKVIDKLTVVGVGPGSTHLEVTVGTGEMEGTFSAKNIHDINTLTSFANATLEQTKQAKHRMTIELAGTERTDFELGDIIHITYSDAGIDGDYRIISMERVSGVAGESTKLEVAVPQFRVTETLMDAKRRLDAEDYHPQGAPSIITLEKSENVNSTHPLTMKFYVPEQAVDMGKLQIREAKIALTLEPFRAHSTGAASGGGQTSQEGLPHTHTISAQTAQSRDLGTKTAQSKDLGTKTALSKDLGTKTSGITGEYMLTSMDAGYTTGSTVTAATVYDSFIYGSNLCRDQSSMVRDGYAVRHKHYMADHSHTVVLGSHDHSVPIGTHDHSVPIGTHDHSVTGATAANESTHTHQISAHTHNIVYGIYTSTYPASVYIKLNGTQIAGPFNADEYVDITTEFLDKITTYGWNTLEFTTAQLGKIGVTLFMSLFLQAS